VVLARAVSRLFDEWNLPARDRAALLGLSETNRSTLAGYAQGRPLAPNRDLLDRAGHLLGIYKNLQILYDRNPEIRRGWMQARNRAFDGHTPVEVVRDKGLLGLTMVRTALDAMRGR
jgi:hypothetical protein